MKRGILESLEQKVAALGAPCQKSEHPFDDQIKFQHITWMMSEIPKILKSGNMEKAMRWIGFIQGVLWSTGKATIEDLKDDNR